MQKNEHGRRKPQFLSLINLCLLKMQKRKTHYSYALCYSRQLFNFPWYNLSHLSKKNFRVTIFPNPIFTRLSTYLKFTEFIFIFHVQIVSPNISFNRYQLWLYSLVYLINVLFRFLLLRCISIFQEKEISLISCDEVVWSMLT